MNVPTTLQQTITIGGADLPEIPEPVAGPGEAYLPRYDITSEGRQRRSDANPPIVALPSPHTDIHD